MKKLVALPRSFPLFSTTSRLRRPSLRELDAALLVCETLLAKPIPPVASLWDLFSSLKLPLTQESWVRALVMDVAGASPYTPDPRAREALYRSYFSHACKELRLLHSEFSKRGPLSETSSATPFSILETLLK